MNSLRTLFLSLALLVGMTASIPNARANSVGASSAVRAAADLLFDRSTELLAKDPATAKALFARTAVQYEHLATITDNQSTRASLLYNAGAAHQLAGNTGMAVLHFRRAELLAPITTGLRERLAAARAEASGTPASAATAPPSSAWQSTLDMAMSLPRSPFWIALLASYVLFWAILLLRILMPTHMPFRPRLSLLWLPVIALLLCAPLLAWSAYRDATARNEIVILTDTTPRAEPDDRIGGPATTASFKPGRELTVIDSRAGGDGQQWLRVAEPGSAADPLSVPIWIPASAAAYVLGNPAALAAPR